MLKYSLLVIVCFLGISLQAQDTIFIKMKDKWIEKEQRLIYQTDTILIDETIHRSDILIGSTILSGSPGLNLLQWYPGLRLSKVIPSQCLSSFEEFGEEEVKVNSIAIMDAIVVFDITIIANCCGKLLFDAAFDKDTGVLNLIQHEYNSYCTCVCCFGLTYEFTITENFDKDKLKAVVINGDVSTIKEIE